MAWFECKGPMRKEIVVNDKWFKNAQEMVSFLANSFQVDPKKEYYYMPEEVTAKLRREGREDHPIVGCKKAHVITFHPDGETINKWTSIKDYLVGGEITDELDSNDNDNGDDGEEFEDENWTESNEDLDVQFN